MSFAAVRAADLYASRNLERMEALGRQRLAEATQEQRTATGVGVAGGYDPIDRSYGFRPVGRGGGPFEVPFRTRDQALRDSIAGYRANPMARAIVDTYVAFCVGDSGLTMQCSSDEVRPVAEAFWKDPRNRLPNGQELMLRSWLLAGEQLQEMMVGELTGVCRRSPINTTRIVDVALRGGNPLWPESVLLRVPGSPFDVLEMAVIDIDDLSGLRSGEAFYWPGFKALETDTRGLPLLAPVLDWLDSYDMVLSNLIDRTALARYISLDVTVDGDQDAVDRYVEARGSQVIPPSGTMEVHTNAVSIKPLSAQTGAFEDAKTNEAVLTSVAAGAGLAKHFLAEPEDTNRATATSMAEPVRRRIGSVQNEHIANITEMVRFAVDRAVAAGRIPAEVAVSGPGGVTMIPAAETVIVTGPAIAAADAEVTAKVMQSLADALERVPVEVLSVEARRFAMQKAFEDYVGVPMRPELAASSANPDDVASHIEDNGGRLPLAVV